VREFKGIEEEKLAGFALDTKNPQVYKPGGSVFSSIRARHDLWTCCGRGLLVSVICEVLLLLQKKKRDLSSYFSLMKCIDDTFLTSGWVSRTSEQQRRP
jgi:hypothetical protein